MACCMMYREDIVPKDVNAAIVTIKTKRSPIGVAERVAWEQAPSATLTLYIQVLNYVVERA